MAVTLGPATEQRKQRIQRKIDQGQFREPAEVIALALDLLDDEAELAQQARTAREARLERSMAQIARGEGIPGERVSAELAQLRAARVG